MNHNQFQDEPAHEKLFKFHRQFWTMMFKILGSKTLPFIGIPLFFLLLGLVAPFELLLIAVPAIIMKLAAGKDQ